MKPCVKMFRSMGHRFFLRSLEQHLVDHEAHPGDNREKEEADDFQNTYDHRDYECDENEDEDNNSHDEFYLRVNDYVCKLLIL